jgi:restriction endonuclease Mrr
MGGHGKAAPDVLDKVYEKMKDKLKKRDLEEIPNGNEPQWRNRTRWEVVRLKNEGFLVKGGPRNEWEITKTGRRR